MTKKVYSHSRLSTFEQCPLKFKFRYIDKLKPEIEKTIESHLGNCVHDTLEWIYIKVKENGKSPSIDDTITHYSENWQNNYTPEILIVKDSMSQKDYFQMGIKFLLNYYLKHKPFDDNTLEVEKKIILDLTDEHQLQGFIDRLVYNEQTKEFEIHDYKTGNTLPSQQKIDEDRQLALYALAIKELFGHDKEVALIWHYLAYNKKITSKRTPNQLQELKKDIIELIKKIESTKEFPAQKSILCNWCEFKTQCPQHNPQTSLDNFPTVRKYLRDV